MSTPPKFEMCEYKPESHKKVSIECQYELTDKCSKTCIRSYRDILKTMKRNDGNFICLYCSRKLKFSGRENPNTKYHNLQDSMFSKIDTEGKAYLLGWIASDGNIAENGVVRISINERDIDVLTNLRDLFDSNIPIKTTKNDCVYFVISSSQISKDVLFHLGLSSYGPKSSSVRFPKITDEELSWAFIRGFFDGDGNIRKRTDYRKTPECQIASNSIEMLNSILEFSKIKGRINHAKLSFCGVNSIDFLSKIYDNSNPKYRLERKFKLYLDWVNTGYVPGLLKDCIRFPSCSFFKTDPNAIIPYKSRASDIGLDLTIIKKVKDISSKTAMYDTCIKGIVTNGYYLKVVPRSSIYKHGYIFSNSMGIIDKNYLGTIKIILTKVDSELPEPILPYRCAQIIIDKHNHCEIDEIYDENYFDETDRGDNGFGSTGLN